MRRTSWLASARYLLRHPWQLGVAVLGIALGVAVVVAIDLANESARRGFSLSTEGLAGRATHHIVGGPAGLPESLYRALRVDVGVRRSAPVVEGYVTAYPPGAQPGPGAASRARTLTLLGVDPFAESPFRGYLGKIGGGGGDLTALLTQPAAVVLERGQAQALGVGLGDPLPLYIGGRRHEARLVGLIDARDERTRRGLDGLLIADIATAQELLGMNGRLSRIDLIVPGGDAAQPVLARIGSVLPPGVEILSSAARAETVEQMTRAFSSNLTALSLLALLVGVFLIYNTMTFTVVQRRALIGVQRALGMTRGEIFAAVLGEALLVGLLGTAAGITLGMVLANGLVQLVTRTINDLYFVLSVSELAITPFSLAKGVALGVIATAAATLPPAYEATTVPPSLALSRSVSESQWRRAVPVAAGGGTLLLGLAAGLLQLSGRSLVLGYVALFAILLGFALLAPLATATLAHGLRPLLGRLFGVLGSLAARGVEATLSRTAVAIAALAVAVSATMGVGIMIDSFRQTVTHWLEHTLRADLYVSVQGEVGARDTLDPGVVQRLAALPGVVAHSTSRVVEIESVRGLTRLVILAIGPRAYPAFRFKEGDPDAIWPAFQHDGAVIVSESYAYRHDLHVGSLLSLRTDRGIRTFPVVGIYYAYASDQGVVTMSRATYEAFWEDRGISGVGLYADRDADLDVLRQSVLRETAAAAQRLDVDSNREILELSLRIFDRTFVITDVLRMLAALVAFLGVLGALMALQLERVRELGALRAIGLTPGQLWRLVTAQTGLMGLAAGLLAIPLGLAMALVLILVINRRSFGWTLQVHIAPEILLQGVLLAVVAAVLAGIYPALKMSRTSPAEALRAE